MTKYEVEFEIPMIGDVAGFIEALRAFGHPKIVFRAETDGNWIKNKHELAENIANEHGRWPYDSPSWWVENLAPIRGNRAKEEI